MKLSFNLNFVNKNGSHNTAWNTYDLTAEEAFVLMTEPGHAWSCELSNSERKEKYFVSRQLFAVDIDEEMTIEELFNDDFYNACGLGFYVTPSHQQNKYNSKNEISAGPCDRFRILFQTELPITNTIDAKAFFIGLRSIYAAGDPNALDAVRLFYGTENCEQKEFLGYIIPDTIVQILINENRPVEKIYESPIYTSTPTDSIIQRLCSITNASHDEWAKIGFGLKQGGYSISDYMRVSRSIKPNKTEKEVEEKFKSASGRVTMGTVHNILKTHGV
jgi:hypothetical protein